MGTVRVGAPMERIAVDLMGPLNETERRNSYILVVQDYFSKWVEAALLLGLGCHDSVCSDGLSGNQTQLHRPDTQHDALWRRDN